MNRAVLRRAAISSVPATFIAFAVSFVLDVIDIFFLTPNGAIAWHDGYGNPVPPHLGEPIYAKPHLVGAPMGFVLASGFLSALIALMISGWPPQSRREKEAHSSSQE